ncbi:MAG: hypothetical protein DRJ14_02745 [Acidobacteria bacterium]|nr:MAG: hypothetical protein DRJ14_02745 [Acidobacteriota bacterium]
MKVSAFIGLADGEQTGEKIYFMDWMNKTDAKGNVTQRIYPTFTIKEVATLTNDFGAKRGTGTAGAFRRMLNGKSELCDYGFYL